MPEISEPHASKHYDGKEDPIDASQLDKMLKIIPYNGKIADIKETDTSKHTLNLATALGETRKIIAVQVEASRITGTGYLFVYPNEGARVLGEVNRDFFAFWCIIKDGTQRLQYYQTVANDDFDLYCYGYVVEA